MEYLGLLENVRVRRAGFANRQTYPRFLQRYVLIQSGGEEVVSGQYSVYTAPDQDSTVFTLPQTRTVQYLHCPRPGQYSIYTAPDQDSTVFTLP